MRNNRQFILYLQNNQKSSLVIGCYSVQFLTFIGSLTRALNSQINIKERLQRCTGVSYVADFMVCIDFEFPPQLQSCISYSPNNALVKSLV
jgi:hypothetical protein